MSHKYLDLLLSPERERVLRRNRPKLLRSMKLSNMLFAILRTDHTLSLDMEQEIMAEKTDDGKISRLLDFIAKRPNSGFETFIKALVETHQDAVALLLDESYAMLTIQERDAAADVSTTDNSSRSPVQVDDSSMSAPNTSGPQDKLDDTTMDGPGPGPALPASHIPANQATSTNINSPTVHGTNALMQIPVAPYPYTFVAPSHFLPNVSMQPMPNHPNSMAYPPSYWDLQLHLMQLTQMNLTHPGSIRPHFDDRARPEDSQISETNISQPSSSTGADSHSVFTPSSTNTRVIDGYQPTVVRSTNSANEQETKRKEIDTGSVNPENEQETQRKEINTVNITPINDARPSSTADGQNPGAPEDGVDVGLPMNSPAEIGHSSSLKPTILEKLLKNHSEADRADVKKFLNAVGNGSVMSIHVKEVSDQEKLSKQIKQANDRNWYRVRRRPHAGLAVLINNSNIFKKSRRHGSEHDMKNLKLLFSSLNFKVTDKTEMSSQDLKAFLADMAKNEDFSNYDIFVLFIMSHGVQGEIFGIDGKSVSVDQLVETFDGKNCKSLRGKPKLFFFQACRGDKISEMSADGANGEDNDDSVYHEMLEKLRQDDSYKPTLPETSRASHNVYQTDDDRTDGDVDWQVHEKADINIAYASFDGYKAWRHDGLGSYFVRALIYVIANHAHDKHINDLLTETSKLMSYLPAIVGTNNIHQTPELRSSLRKQLYFFPGYDGRDFI